MMHKMLLQNFIAVSVCWWGFIGTAARADAEVPGVQKKQGKRLFNGRDFEGWRQHGNWKMKDGSFHCEGPGGDLSYHAQTIPGDFELVFEWKREGTKERMDDASPFFSMNFNLGLPTILPARATPDNPRFKFTYGTGIDYSIPGINVRLHTMSTDRPHHVALGAASGFSSSSPVKDFSKPLGRWNESRVLCKRSRIQFWLNGEKAFDITLDDQKCLAEQEDAVGKWVKAQDRGFHLSLSRDPFRAYKGERVDLRGFKVRKLSNDEKVFETDVAAESSKPRDRESGPEWDWRKDPLFGKLAIESKKLPKGCKPTIPTEGFGPVTGLTNPGATNAPTIILYFSRFDLAGALESSAVKAMFIAEYEDRGEMWTVAWQLDSSKSAKKLYDHLSKNKDPKELVWLRGQYVIRLSAEPDIPAASFTYLRNHVENTLAKIK